MADRIIKGDSGNDVIIQNNDASRKIEVTNSGDVEVTGDVKTTTVKATNLKANDGTAALEIADSTGDIGFSGNTNLKIKLPSAGGIYESDGSTEIITESSGSVSLKNTSINSSCSFPAGHCIQVVQKSDATDYSNSTTSAVQATQTDTFTLNNSSNKVLVSVNCLAAMTRSSASGIRLAIYRGSVATGTKITSGSEPQIYASDAGTEFQVISFLQFLDAPSSSTATYSLGFWKHSSSGTVNIKGSFFNTIIVLQEISV